MAIRLSLSVRTSSDCEAPLAVSAPEALEAKTYIPVFWLALFQPQDVKIGYLKHEDFDEASTDQIEFAYIAADVRSAVDAAKKRRQAILERYGFEHEVLFGRFLERLSDHITSAVVVDTQDLALIGDPTEAQKRNLQDLLNANAVAGMEDQSWSEQPQHIKEVLLAGQSLNWPPNSYIGHPVWRKHLSRKPAGSSLRQKLWEERWVNVAALGFAATFFGLFWVTGSFAWAAMILAGILAIGIYCFFKW